MAGDLRVMYLCNCNGLSERSVRDALKPCAETGACPLPSVAALFDGFGCRPRCGKCVGELRQLIERMQLATRMPVAAE
ncbi:MAG: bacterioferritin-associated ferredoxin [Dongiaceae bacterium]